MIKKQSIKATPHQLKKIYAEVHKRDHGICQVCKGVVLDDRAYHHIVLKSRLHIDAIENLSLVHTSCHNDIHGGHGITVDEFFESKKDQLGGYYYYRTRN